MRILLVALTSLALAACGKHGDTAPAPQAAAAGVVLVSVTLGNAVNTNQEVATPATAFTPKDTIYASVATTGAGNNVQMAAKWTFQDGQTVSDSTTAISPTGPASTAFHIAKPEGFPPGTYKIDVTVNGGTPISQSFAVK
jgi:hypothetical protein